MLAASQADQASNMSFYSFTTNHATALGQVWPTGEATEVTIWVGRYELGTKG